MGAWSHESFGNDDACDWAFDLEESTDTTVIEAALDAVIETGEGYLDVREASNAIAAAETIARLQGNFGVRDGYTEAVDEWVAKTAITPSVDLLKRAHRAIERILVEPSELLGLWQETEYADDWLRAVADLKARIKL